jgi:hypothetical protein
MENFAHEFATYAEQDLVKRPGLDRRKIRPRRYRDQRHALVDVMLVLLVIFMVTAPMLGRASISNLPQEGGGNLVPVESGWSPGQNERCI